MFGRTPTPSLRRLTPKTYIGRKARNIYERKVRERKAEGVVLLRSTQLLALRAIKATLRYLSSANSLSYFLCAKRKRERDRERQFLDFLFRFINLKTIRRLASRGVCESCRQNFFIPSYCNFVEGKKLYLEQCPLPRKA